MFSYVQTFHRNAEFKKLSRGNKGFCYSPEKKKKKIIHPVRVLSYRKKVKVPWDANTYEDFM